MSNEESDREGNEDIIEISAEDLETDVPEESPLPSAEDILVIDHEDLAEVEQRPLTEAPASYRPRSPTIIGSSQKADICLVKDPQVVAEHARIDRERNHCVLADLGAGQTAVNDQWVTRKQLRDGDYVTIGQTVLRYETRALQQLLG